MTRKDFEAIAVALKAAQPDRGNRYAPRTLQTKGAAARTQWERDVDAVAAVFAAGNPRFDLARFRRACGWES
jgi:hypothetical protein